MDFTLKQYELLLNIFLNKNYKFISFENYILKKDKYKNDCFVILRHDVDDRPENSLQMAQLESSMGIFGSYYFRAVRCSWNEKIIKEISSLGHEVGYHYETMDTSNGDIDKAWAEFQYHLKELRKLVDVKTVCMHGSPKSKFDNKEIWNTYDYRAIGLIGEPYYDIPFDIIFYLTDTGRMWDGYKVSIRDKVKQQESWIKRGLTFHSTLDIIDSLNDGVFPKQLMINLHPQRWNVKLYPWFKELISQNIKNIIKRFILSKKVIEKL